MSTRFIPDDAPSFGSVTQVGPLLDALVVAFEHLGNLFIIPKSKPHVNVSLLKG